MFECGDFEELIEDVKKIRQQAFEEGEKSRKEPNWQELKEKLMKNADGIIYNTSNEKFWDSVIEVIKTMIQK